MLHLVRDVLEPVLRGLRLRDHVRELRTDYRLRMQGLAERLALVHPLQALLDDKAHVARATAAHRPSLVVEVAAGDAVSGVSRGSESILLPENDEDAVALGAKRVLDGNLDVLKGDVGSSSGARVRGLDRLRLNALTTLNENDCETLVGLAPNSEARRTSATNPQAQLDPLTSPRTCRS